jgi:hypothetical protein
MGAKVFNLHAAETARVDADLEPKRHGDKCLQYIEKVRAGRTRRRKRKRVS